MPFADSCKRNSSSDVNVSGITICAHATGTSDASTPDGNGQVTGSK